MPAEITNPFSGQDTETCSIAMKYTAKQYERMKKLGLTEEQYERRLAAARARGAKRRSGVNERPKGEAPTAVKPGSESTGSMTDKEFFDDYDGGDFPSYCQQNGYSATEGEAKLFRYLDSQNGRIPSSAMTSVDKAPKAFTPPKRGANGHVVSTEKAEVVEAKAHLLGIDNVNTGWTHASLANQATIAPRSAQMLGSVEKLTQADLDAAGFGSNVPAYYTPSLREIRIGKLDWGEYKEVAERCVSTRWWSHSKPKYHGETTLAHEFGHHIDAMAKRWSAVERRDLVDDIAEAIGVPKRTGTLPGGKGFKESITDYFKREEFATALQYNLSRYGTTNIEEMFAEIWAEYTTGRPPRPWVVKIGDKMQALAERGASK